MNLPFRTIGLIFFIYTISCACEAPPWATTPPQSSGYWLGQGSGSSIEQATGAAWAHVFSQLAMSNVSEIRAEVNNIQRETNGVVSDSFISNVKANGYIASDGRKLFKVMQTEQVGTDCDGLYHYYLLLCTPQAGCLCRQTIPSNEGALARSVFVPGWGQVYKGNTAPGVTFLSSVLLCTAGSVVCSFLSSQNGSRAADARTADTRNYYIGWRDGTFYASITFGIVATGLYAWNLFDSWNSRAVPEYK